jgi:2-keto-4-pentenoate hydratase
MATKTRAKRRAMPKSAKTHRTKAPAKSAKSAKPDRSKIQALAKRIRDAYASGVPCKPVRDELKPGDIDAAYAIQQANTDFWLKGGRRLVGRKIGLTAKAVQRQLGVDQPDYGMLFADMLIGDGEDIPLERAMQPRVEAEVALVLERDLTREQPTVAEIIMATAYAVPSIEVVGSRIANWDIKIQDTIADNASGALFVLGGPPRRLEGLDLRLCGMVMERRGEQISIGAGAACLGNPLNAAAWLARKMVEVGMPLKAGDVIMTGALGPMVAVAPGDVIEAKISGLGSVRAVFPAKA